MSARNADNYRSVRSRMPVLSATIFDAVFVRRIQNLPAGADNRLVAGLSPPGPTTHSHANRDFPWFDEYPRFCGGAGPACTTIGSFQFG